MYPFSSHFQLSLQLLWVLYFLVIISNLEGLCLEFLSFIFSFFCLAVCFACFLFGFFVSCFSSVLGAVILSLGFYGLIWGKAKEEEMASEDSGPNLGKTPLLQRHEV